MARGIFVYQIAYSQSIIDDIEQGYLPLDNIDNPRPDWREYWPMRKFLLANKLDENSFYGFFSPKFGAKTQLDYNQMRAFVESRCDTHDVLLFSPQPDMASFFLNVFEQGETFDQGFIRAFEMLLEAAGHKVKLSELVTDSRNTVFSNFIVARPAFWRLWLELGEKLFEICEGDDSPLKAELTKTTTYGEGVSRKVFIMERIATFVLLANNGLRVASADPFTFGWSMTRFRDFPDEAVISDALKIAHSVQGYPEYMQVFSRLRQKLFQSGGRTSSGGS